MATSTWLPLAFTTWARAERFARCAAGLTIGLWLAAASSAPPENCVLPDAGPSRKAWIEATIVAAPSRRGDELRLEVEASLVRGARLEPICGRLLLRIAGADVPLDAGLRIRLHAHLRRPRNFRNPGAYDAVGALARRGTWATAFANAASVTVVGHEALGWSGAVALERARLGRLVDSSLPMPESGLLRALVIGDTGGIDDRLWDDVSRTGLAHLLSVSGLHIGMVWGIVFALVRWAASRSELLLLHGNVRTVAGLVALVPAAAYGALAGGRAPTARAVWMALFVTLAFSCGREVRPLRVLVLAALVLSVVTPGAPLEISFQLSFVAVIGLVAANERWARARDDEAGSPHRIRSAVFAALLTPAAALVATAPLTALHFNRLSLAGIVTNPVAVPVCGLPATVLGLVGATTAQVSDEAARVVFGLSFWPLWALYEIATAAAQLPGASLRMPTPTLLEVALAYAAIAVPWIPERLRRASLLAIVVVVSVDGGFWIRERLLSPYLRFRFLDVGQGDATVVELPGRAVIVVDGGGFPNSDFDVGERVVARYLWTRKILRVDALVVTHGDFDHQGGLHALSREFSPKELWRNANEADSPRLESLSRSIRERGGRVRTVHAGEILLRHGELAIECLHPPPRILGLSANDASLVLRVSFRGLSILLTGDVEARGETILNGSATLDPVTLLKVAHHGSRTSSTDTFLQRVRPRTAVISAGAGNRYGFPHPEVMARFRALGGRILRTDRDGSIAVTSDGRRFDVSPFSRASPSFCSGLGVLC